MSLLPQGSCSQRSRSSCRRQIRKQRNCADDVTEIRGQAPPQEDPKSTEATAWTDHMCSYGPRSDSQSCRCGAISILNRVRNAPILYVDETSIKVQGERHWIWAFTTPSETFIVIRKSRGMKVLMEVLTRRFDGIIVCDGWKPYAKFTKRLQRCWTHLLRESKDLADKIEEAVPLHGALKDLYKELTDTLENDPPPEVRMGLLEMARSKLHQWIMKEYVSEKVKKLIGKISNGFEYWFTFIIQPAVEPTNNRAERALREHVLRKIIGTLRNEKGTSIHERIMTVQATWEQNGLDGLKMLRSCLIS